MNFYFQFLRSEMEQKQAGWDAFKLQSVEVPKRCDKIFFDALLQVSKVVAYVVTFLLIFVLGITSKLFMLLLTSNIRNGTLIYERQKCAVLPSTTVRPGKANASATNKFIDLNAQSSSHHGKFSSAGSLAHSESRVKNFDLFTMCFIIIQCGCVSVVEIDHREKYVAVIWSICFCILAPEIITWISCVRKVLLRQIHGPQTSVTWIIVSRNTSKRSAEVSLSTFVLQAFITETLHLIGILLFLFEVLPNTDITSGLMLTSALCFVPAALAMFSRSRTGSYFVLQIILDIVAFACQFSALLFGVFSESGMYNWTLPGSLVLISVRWWENYVSADSPFSFIRWLSRHRTNIDQTQTKIYLFLSLWKIIVVLGWIAAWHSLSSGNRNQTSDVYSE